MLYELHEMQHAALNPLLLWAQTNAGLYSNPYSVLSYLPGSRNVAAGYELLLRLGQRYEKPEFGLTETTIDGETILVHEEVAAHKPFCQLRHFNRATKRQDPTVLVVAPLSGHHSTLLRDTVRTLLPEHDVYITDWTDARMVPLSEGVFHLDDYVAYVQEFIRLLGPDVHVISVCQPTVPVLAAVSLMASNGDLKLPRSMIMMGGPIDARQSPTAVNQLAQRKPYSWFENRLIQHVPAKYPGYMRRVYPGFLQYAGFVAMNPHRHIESHYDYYLHLVSGDGESAEAHRKFYDEYNAVQDLPAEYYLDTIKTVFQEHALPEGRMLVRGERVAPETIRTVALYTIEGELDDISGAGQTRAAHQLCCNIPEKNKHHLTAKGAGHYGIFSGRRWREEIFPHVRSFIRRHG